MQKIVYVQNDELDEVNKLLEDGWYIKDIKPVAATGNRLDINCCCYILLEKK